MRKNMSQSSPLLLSGLMTVLGLTAVLSAQAAAPADAMKSLPARELKNLQQDVERYRAEQDWKNLQEDERREETVRPVEAERLPGGLQLTLRKFLHTPSLILTEEEFQTTVAPWVDREISTDEIADILNALNRLYADKGYLVCQAMVEPQRIHEGELTITLVEGVTDSVAVEGNPSTRESYLTRSLPIKAGEVANYRDMIDSLVRFNMTNDVKMRVDIGAGEKARTTAYRLMVDEPPRWTGTFFADSLGSDSTGRGRAGASIVNRSLFGWRDQLSLLAMTSEGNKSAMLSYSVPLTSTGTRLTLSGSAGDVDVIEGPGDVEGQSFMGGIRLDHPLLVRRDLRLTAWADVTRQTSETDMFTIRVNDTDIDAYTLGLDGLWLTERGYLAGGVSVSDRHADEVNVSRRSHGTLMKANAFFAHYFASGQSVALRGEWVSLLDGETVSSDYFYLGNANGVRGYDNDLITAPSGWSVSAEVTQPLGTTGWSLFAFADAGHLAGETVTTTRALYSTGFGAIFKPVEGADFRLTAAIPLNRDLDETVDAHVDKVRLDLTASYTW